MKKTLILMLLAICLASCQKTSKEELCKRELTMLKDSLANLHESMVTEANAYYVQRYGKTTDELFPVSEDTILSGWDDLDNAYCNIEYYIRSYLEFRISELEEMIRLDNYDDYVPHEKIEPLEFCIEQCKQDTDEWLTRKRKTSVDANYEDMGS